MSNKHQELLGVPKHANQHRLSRLTMEVHTDELRIMASAVESYTDELIAAPEAAEKRIAELEARMLSQAATDVLAERHRQVTAEGWTPEHDDKYRHSEMLWAACCYVLNTIQKYNRVPFDWPWRDEWWKPTEKRRDLVKAGALIIAEIECIDRAAGIGKGE